MDECSQWRKISHCFKEVCSRFDELWIKRRRIFTTEKIVHMLLNLVATKDHSYKTISTFTDFSLPKCAASSFCEARSKFPSFVLSELREETLDTFDSEFPPHLWHGLRVHAVDGSKLALPRELFSEAFKAPTGGYCPQGLLSALVRVDDKMICDIFLSPDENERNAAHRHLEHLSANDLVIYDRGYLSYSLLSAHLYLGIHAVFRVQKGKSFKAIESFWKSKKVEEVVTLKPSDRTVKDHVEKYPEYAESSVKIRLIKYKIKGDTYVLATTFLDAQGDRNDFKNLYPSRWECEEVFKGLKKSLGLENLHAKNLNGVEQEILASALFWNLTQMTLKLSETVIQSQSTNKGYDYQANMKQTIRLMASMTVDLLSSGSRKVVKALRKLFSVIVEYLLPIRKGRSFRRQSLKPPTHWKRPRDKSFKLKR